MSDGISSLMEAIESAFIYKLRKLLNKLRNQRLNILEHLCECRRMISKFLQRYSDKQTLVDKFQEVSLVLNKWTFILGI